MTWWQADLEILGFPRKIVLQFEAAKAEKEATKRFQEILNELYYFLLFKRLVVKSPVMFYKIDVS